MTSQFIYFAEACGKIKIGCSVRPPKRLEQIGEWIPYPITLLATMKGSYALESAIHRMFGEEWSHGEWFHISPRLTTFINDVAADRPVSIDVAAVSTRRAEAIADKKRYSRRLGKFLAWYSSPLHADYQALPGATAIPDELRAKLDAFLAEQSSQSAERTVGDAASASPLFSPAPVTTHGLPQVPANTPSGNSPDLSIGRMAVRTARVALSERGSPVQTDAAAPMVLA